MAWMLHDTRLRAEVPIFCVSAVKPMLNNGRAPVSVGVGAVKLLYLLHERLEVSLLNVFVFPRVLLLWLIYSVLSLDPDFD